MRDAERELQELTGLKFVDIDVQVDRSRNRSVDAMQKLSPGKILIVDANVRTMATMAQTLLRNGYQVIHATNEAKAVRVSKLDKPDLIIFNTESKKLDVEQLLKSIRTMRPTQPIPFLLITESEQPEKETQGNLSRKQQLSSPYTREQLTIAVQENIKRLQPMRRKHNSSL